jgi:dsDNA-specific endonuclease/ATPase MutS2
MKLKIGDRVKFLNDTGGGKVTNFINNDMVSVLNEDGFEVPVLREELLKVEEEGSEDNHQYSFDETEEDFEESEEEYDSFAEAVPEDAVQGEKEDPGDHVYFSFVPLNEQNPVNDDLETYLINDSNFSLYYLILLKRGNSFVYFSSGNLEENAKIFIKNIEKERFNEIKHFRLQFLFYKKGFYNPVLPLDIPINLQPQKFFKSGTFKENEFFDENAFVLRLKKEEAFAQKISSLTEEQIDEAIKEKEATEKPVAPKSPETKNQDMEEVDLHIEELVDKPKELSNKEMLDIQMGKFQLSLEGALKTPKTKKIIFIHGVGNGRLRYEIRKYLDRYYPNLDYQDASFKEYGYGATLVFLRK